MVNDNLLEEKIRKSGLRVNYIAETLGITKQGLWKKRKGLSNFNTAEIYVICDLLKITDSEEKQKIFYPES